MICLSVIVFPVLADALTSGVIVCASSALTGVTADVLEEAVGDEVAAQAQSVVVRPAASKNEVILFIISRTDLLTYPAIIRTSNITWSMLTF
ncbi:hypothetical protein GCM10007391_32250 [Alteromonas halophila]|uniref:Uncharacterized protein n=1 Tax=Alteromonas halophila TaxID=516698 RepID=A0A918N015_9ALTE|nr:hypothetical protein GCM10007391_32250 [Alteromonas halophila]